jgi:hypothetical protein
MNKFKLITVFAITLTLVISACSKGAGEGGKATIYGKVRALNYDATFTTLQASYYAQEENVFIIYGDDRSYSQSVKTNYDGTYEFRYLRPGNYTVVVYSKDSARYNGNIIASKTVEVVKDVQISGKKDEVEVPEITILK